MIGENLWQLKLTGEENFSLFQKNAVEMSTKMILNRCLLLTQHDVKNCSKTLLTLRHGRRSSIKMHHYETLPNVLFLKWKQCTAIVKCISVPLGCDPLSVTENFCWFNEEVQNHKMLTEIFHPCVTLITHRHLGS